MTAFLLAVVFALSSVASAAPVFPPLTGRVTDDAHVLPADVTASLTAKLEALQTSTGTQLVVATVPSLDGNPIEDYANGLFRNWKLGDSKVNNGVLLLVAPTEHKVRVEVGYGFEDRLTDALSATIIRNQIIPRFKADDLPGGVAAGTDALIQQLQLPADQARANVAAAATQFRSQHHGSPGFGGFVWLAIILLWLFFSAFRGSRGRSSGIGNAILWGVASGMFNNRGNGGGWGGGGGGGWGGGDGGGGFSGGGGSSGGGGASGSW